MKLYEALANAFRRERVETCFALLGDANMHWAGALAEQGARLIYTRHEHAAVAGAAAYARSTGKTGCATVTCGPGLTQVLTILPIAVRAKLPLVVFAGEAPLHKAWYNQGIDQRPFVEACGAIYLPLHDTSEMLTGIHKAFAIAADKRIPVVLGVPFDVQQHDWEGVLDEPISDAYRQRPDPVVPDESDIAEAAMWINSSERPVVLAGLGAIDARSAIVDMAAQAGALLATTLPAKGLFRGEDYNLGVAGGFATERSKAIFSQSDLVIGIGTRLAAHAFDSGRLTPDARVIHIDIDPRETVQGRKASDLQIRSDAGLGVQALIPRLDGASRWRKETMRQRTQTALELPDLDPPSDGYLHPMDVVKALQKAIPENCHVVNTSGHSAYYSAHMNQTPQDHFTVIREFGAIGNGTSFALGVAAAHPDRPVVLIDGDGSALMHIQELETMQRHGFQVLTIVLNDGAYGSEVHKLRADGVSVEGSVFGRPDFAGIGRGFGIEGRTITSTQGIGSAFQEFLQSGRPSIWDIHISDEVASPQILKAHKAAHA